MLDPRYIRSHPEEVRIGLEKKGETVALDEFLQLDEKRRKILVEVEGLRAQLNTASKEIGEKKRRGEPVEELMKEAAALREQIKELDQQLSIVEQELEAILLRIPNIPHPSVPVGDESASQVVRTWGEIRSFSFPPKPHWEIGHTLGILDFERATRVTGVGGVGFPLFKGEGALLTRALINFMLDLHTTKHKYQEVWPPALASRASLIGTAQLPKFEEDMYRVESDDLFLIPTAEVPLANLHREEILDGSLLPLYYTAYTPCFRREAGAAGKDTRGLLRVHQFDKVELVKVCRPEESYEELEKMVRDAEEVLQLLELPYRVVLLASQDLTFASAKTYDLEVYAPGVDRWLEVSSCSNTEAFQARRSNTRYRPAPRAKPEFVHLLNGSGVALPRLIAALLENNQEEDGSVRLPEVLWPYMGGKKKLESSPDRRI